MQCFRRLAIAKFGVCFAATALFAAPLFVAPAFAATATATMAVSATVQATCQIAATGMAFGTYVGTQIDSTATITITCTNTTPYTIGIDAGLGVTPAATVTTRHMTGPAAANLNYGLYKDAARATNWGLTPVTDTVAGTGNGSAQPITVYGRVQAAQFVAPGAYTDTVTATVTY